MATLKLFLSSFFLASAAVLSENDEWRLFGGLMAGGTIGGVCGMLLVGVTGVKCQWQVYAARLVSNILGSLGLGAIGLYFSIYTFGAHPGPFLTVGHGFAFGVIGVGAFKAILEKRLLARLEKLADDAMNSAMRGETPPKKE